MPTPGLIILTDPRFKEIVFTFLPQAAPELSFQLVNDLDGLTSAIDLEPRARIISFVTSSIVPSNLLNRTDLPDYNIHPGTPAYPGAFPEIRARIDKAERFGATLHELAKKVDSGTIIAVEEQLVADLSVEQLGFLGFECALALLGYYAPRIIDSRTPLEPSGHKWNGPVMTSAQVLALANLA